MASICVLHFNECVPTTLQLHLWAVLTHLYMLIHQVKQLQAVHSAALISVTALNAAGARLISTINSAPFPCWNHPTRSAGFTWVIPGPKNASFREVVDMWYVIFFYVQPFPMQRFGSLSNWNNHLYNQWLVIRFQEWRFLCNGRKSPRHRRRSCHPSRRPPGHLSLPGARLVLTWGKLRWLLVVVCRFHFEMIDLGKLHDFSIPLILPRFWYTFSSFSFSQTVQWKHGKLCQGRLWATWSLTRSCLRVINEKLDGQIGMMDDAIQYMFQKTETSW